MTKLHPLRCCCRVAGSIGSGMTKLHLLRCCCSMLDRPVKVHNSCKKLAEAV